MALTETEIAHIRRSYDLMKSEIPNVAHEFYADLFRRDPRIRAMFREDVEGQGMRFMAAVGAVIHHLDDPEGLAAETERLAEGHAHFGIRPEMYHTMEEALIDTFRYALGARLTSEAQLAWRHAFSEISEAMKQAA